MKTNQYSYWIATLIMSAVFLFSINIHLFQTDMVKGFYESLQFPTWWVVPSGILKLLALIAILSNLSRFLKEWAYAGLFFDAAMALGAHQTAQDGGSMFSIIALVSIVVSRFFWGKRGH